MNSLNFTRGPQTLEYCTADFSNRQENTDPLESTRKRIGPIKKYY